MGLLQQLTEQQNRGRSDVVLQDNSSIGRSSTTLSAFNNKTEAVGLSASRTEARSGVQGSIGAKQNSHVEYPKCSTCGCDRLWLDIYDDNKINPHCLNCDPPSSFFLLSSLIRARPPHDTQDARYSDDRDWDDWSEGTGTDARHVMHRRSEAIRRDIGPGRRWTAAEWDLGFVNLWVDEEQRETQQNGVGSILEL